MLGWAHEIKQVAVWRGGWLLLGCGGSITGVGDGVDMGWVNEGVFCGFAGSEWARLLAILDCVIAFKCFLQIVVH